MPELNGMNVFPCPICTEPREVRMTKKKKPYITCDPCGVQLFVRGPGGIAAFDRLLERAEVEDLGPGSTRWTVASTSSAQRAVATSGSNPIWRKRACSTEASRGSAVQPRTAGRSCRGKTRNENHCPRSHPNRCGVYRCDSAPSAFSARAQPVKPAEGIAACAEESH